jgi:hypothetical protein
LGLPNAYDAEVEISVAKARNPSGGVCKYYYRLDAHHVSVSLLVKPHSNSGIEGYQFISIPPGSRSQSPCFNIPVPMKAHLCAIVIGLVSIATAQIAQDEAQLLSQLPSCAVLQRSLLFLESLIS